MSLESLAIVGGCGHVGLPLGIVFADHGYDVRLIDSDEERAAQVASGIVPFQERGAKSLLESALEAGRLTVQKNLAGVDNDDIVFVTVGTPVDDGLDPELDAFNHVLTDVLSAMRAGQLLVLRSTLFPGMTRRIEKKLRDRHLDIDLAYCPERIAQGYAIEELSQLPQLVGGCTLSATSRARRLFESIGAAVIELSPIEAELGKLFTNAYRYINFAISNQFYMITSEYDANFDRVYRAVTHNYPRMEGFSQSGFAAGPCLRKDTMQLAAFRHDSFALGHAALMVNSGFPSFAVDLLDGMVDLEGKTVGILGMAFKGDSDDPRDSLAYRLRRILKLKCDRVLCTDPHIDDPEFVPLEDLLESADAFIVGAPHQEYRDLEPSKAVVDVFNHLSTSAP